MSTTKKKDKNREPIEKTVGLLASFPNPKALIDATKSVRAAGYTKFDTHVPYPVHGLDKAMGLKPSPLGYIVFIGGLTGCFLGWLMQWWMGGVDYPLNISGKPFFALPPSIPVIFELTILLSAFTAVFGMFALNKLPRPYNPLFNVENFQRVTDDRFFLYVESSDPKYHDEKTWSLLKDQHPETLEIVPEYE